MKRFILVAIATLITFAAFASPSRETNYTITKVVVGDQQVSDYPYSELCIYADYYEFVSKDGQALFIYVDEEKGEGTFASEGKEVTVRVKTGKKSGERYIQYGGYTVYYSK